jgi:hypothetical protein
MILGTAALALIPSEGLARRMTPDEIYYANWARTTAAWKELGVNLGDDWCWWGISPIFWCCLDNGIITPGFTTGVTYITKVPWARYMGTNFALQGCNRDLRKFSTGKWPLIKSCTDDVSEEIATMTPSERKAAAILVEVWKAAEAAQR